MMGIVSFDVIVQAEEHFWKTCMYHFKVFYWKKLQSLETADYVTLFTFDVQFCLTCKLGLGYTHGYLQENI